MLTDDQVKELEAKHGRVAHCKSKGGGWEIVLKKPVRKDYKQFRAQLQNPAVSGDAQEILVTKCVVYPERQKFLDLLDEWPAIPEAVSKPLMALMNLELEEDLKD